MCLVDYSCPDHAGDWFSQRFAKEIAEGRACVERVTNQAWFSKTRAHNAGARRALREGAEYLCFLDADTIVEPGFWEHLIENARPKRFLIAGKERDGSDVPSMTGLLLVRGHEFDEVDGFDESFQGWGGEDIELRIRLYMVGGLDFGFVPTHLARPIPHDDSLRSQFYAVRNIMVSNRENMNRLRQRMAHEWLGHTHRDPAGAAQLWYRPPASSQYLPRHGRLNTSEASVNPTSATLNAQLGRRLQPRRGGY
jgi:predicted glycosyltransferase involved in capsule biosynthesis